MLAESITAMTLLRVIALVCALACVAWGLMAGPGRMERRSTLRFLMANLLLVSSVFLTLDRSHVVTRLDYWSSYWLADMAGLAAIALYLHGIEYLLRLPPSRRLVWGTLLLCGASMALLPYPEAMVRVRGSLFSGGGGVLSLMIFRQSVRGLRESFGPIHAMAAGSIFGALSLIMFSRVTVLVFWPEVGVAMETTSVGSSAAILWASLVMILLVNIALSALLLLSLVARIRHLALHDELTGCLNRRAMQQRLDEEAQRWRRAPGTNPLGSVIMFDLDHFKRINDEHGHAAGDSALKHVARVVRAELRRIDALGRWGGEEFLLLLPLTDAAHAQDAAARIRSALAGSHWQWGGTPITLTASFAVAGLSDGQLDFEALDRALYRAKAAGRNRVERAVPASVPIQAPPDGKMAA